MGNSNLTQLIEEKIKPLYEKETAQKKEIKYGDLGQKQILKRCLTGACYFLNGERLDEESVQKLMFEERLIKIREIKVLSETYQVWTTHSTYRALQKRKGLEDKLTKNLKVDCIRRNGKIIAVVNGKEVPNYFHAMESGK
ncbi:MAG: hypothetical protein KAS32_13110 [Candidatus Peribacteraceae bacterium]|nr:hypothetical protein [Candidatus Peribacteraceae bacterium]